MSATRDPKVVAAAANVGKLTAPKLKPYTVGDLKRKLAEMNVPDDACIVVSGHRLQPSSILRLEHDRTRGDLWIL